MQGGELNRTAAKLPSDDMPEAFCRLPLFRPVATKLLQLLADEEVPLAKLSQFIQADPGFSAEVLHIANSPIYGLAAKISSVSHALVILGLERTRSLALTVALRGYLKKTPNLPLVKNFWHHALATAQLCEDFGPLFAVPRDKAYTAGLMHDIGRLGLMAAYPREYSALADRIFTSVESVLEAETNAFGVTHCQAGFWLTKTWGFPLTLCEAALEHHPTSIYETNPLLSLVRFSCQLASSMEFATFRYQATPAPEAILQQLPEALHARLRWNEAEVRQRVEVRAASLTHL